MTNLRNDASVRLRVVGACNAETWEYRIFPVSRFLQVPVGGITICLIDLLPFLIYLRENEREAGLNCRVAIDIGCVVMRLRAAFITPRKFPLVFTT